MAGFKPFKIEHAKAPPEIDPVKIFYSLTLRGTVNDLWPPQIDALTKWNAKRALPDVSVEMNTGGGKTLVGLLIAMSLGRELGKMVLYACPTKQLIQQTQQRAQECSIEVATYYGGKWTDETIASSGAGPCLTTHQAIFNGESIFADRDIGAVVLDDAHVAGNAIRDCFTLRIPRSLPVYDGITALFRPYFARSGYQLTFDEVVAGKNRELLFVPLFESGKHANLIQKQLVEGRVTESLDTRFAWAHIKNHLDRCVILFNNEMLEIAPACSPTEQTPLFKKNVRRVYLTATLPSPIEFYRSFGTLPQAVRPMGRLGEAQRVFLAPKGLTDDEQRQDAKDLLSDRKALILTTSHAGAAKWTDCAQQFASNDGQPRIDAFAKASAPEKLVMAARYDGVDLPGDACRILVLDGLPRGEALLPRYLNETLRIEAIRAATTAIRVVQAVGRIFRSNTDHGAVILVGGALQRWLSSPSNRAFLPPLLQQQLDLALEIDNKIKAGEFTAEDVLDELLKGTKNWDTFYKDNIGQFSAKPAQAPPSWLTQTIKIEREAHRLMWAGDFQAAAAEYARAASDAKGRDDDLSAWNRHFEGYCLERAGKSSLSGAAYNAAANQRGSLGRPRSSITGKPMPVSGAATQQAQAILRNVKSNGIKALALGKKVVENLQYGPATAPTEQATKDLGTLLGLVASRPDKEGGIGPDALWMSPDDDTGWGFEAKTDKKEDGYYNKEDTGQAHEHREWLDKQFSKRKIGLSLVGRMLPVTSSATPADDLTIIDLAGIQELARRTVQLYEAITSGSQDADSVEAWVRHLGLEFPRCVAALPMVRAIDQQPP